MTDTLISELWGETPPRRAENALQAHVSRLRRELDKLEPDRDTPSLVTLPTGYRLPLQDDSTDAMVFMRLIGDVLQINSDPRNSVEQLREALSLWRGPAFGGAVGGLLCQSLAARYEQSRITALELLFDLELQNSRSAEIIAELYEITESEPLNEKLYGLLMIALYRTARQADALAAYRKIRDRLNEELGIDPSPALKKYEHAILTQDPALDAPAVPAQTTSPLAP